MLKIKVNKIRSYQVLVYKRGRNSFRTKEYKDYIAEIIPQLKPLPKIEGDTKLTVHFKHKNKVAPDLDNSIKPISDILEMNGNIKNDRQIVEMSLKKSFGYEDNTIELEITKIE